MIQRNDNDKFNSKSVTAILQFGNSLETYRKASWRME